MTAAGIIAAVDPGSGALSRTGAFSAQAQACALIALAAVLVPIARWRSNGQGKGERMGGSNGAYAPPVQKDESEEIGIGVAMRAGGADGAKNN
jgi:arabinofuranan 3-O-arabinosyltransferase